MKRKNRYNIAAAQKRCGCQAVDWAKVDGIMASIKETETIRDNMLRIYNDRKLQQQFEEKLYGLRKERDELLANIEADRQRMARMLITSLACCDLAATMAERFSDELKKVSKITIAGNGYTDSVKEARTHTNKVLKDILDSERLWEGLVSTIDAPNDNTTSMRYADISERFAQAVQPIVIKFEREMEDKYTEQF